ncbi:MerR family transcriptional regulator [Microbacterium sp.]|uniref:MerR family transcriptional regulator n=1 Tax=Microbacterium sp. TaxID=51671 RepID=UPI002811501D|nr:MerR family transcriptional regulator [Microbacterium sp.]
MTRPREREEVPLPVAAPRTLLPIGAFAQAVGLSASALRQYGESGLLIPTEIDGRTGYRYYAPDQQRRAIWIRRLRDAGLGLGKIGAILDGDAAEAERLLDAWLTDAAERQSAATALVADLKLSLRARVENNPVHRTTAGFDGAVLANAIEQVTAASGIDGFHSVLMDITDGEAAVVATDRYLLLARLAVSRRVSGPPARVSFTPGSVAAWLRSRRRVDLVVESPIGRNGRKTMHAHFCDDAGHRRELERERDLLPSVHALLQDRSGAPTRIVFPRTEVLRVSRSTGSLSLIASEGEARLHSDAGVAAGSADGRAVSLELSAATLTRIAEAAVGPALSCDVDEPGAAVVWRAPSQPDFVALAMPQSR